MCDEKQNNDKKAKKENNKEKNEEKEQSKGEDKMPVVEKDVNHKLERLKQRAESRKNNSELHYYTNKETKRIMSENAELLYHEQINTLDDNES